ncbi:MAG: hypothetical protein AB7O92_23140 [Acidimicrobiia bacterium]
MYLCAWTRQLTLQRTALARATHKTLRYKLFHTAGRHRGRRLDLDLDCAHTSTITTALTREFPSRTGAVAQKFAAEGYFTVLTTRTASNAAGLEEAIRSQAG